MALKLRLLKSLVLLYGSETWTLNGESCSLINAFHRKCLRRILRIQWFHRVTNDRSYTLSGIREKTSTIIRKCLCRILRIQWFLLCYKRSVLHFIRQPREDVNHYPQVSSTHLKDPMVQSCYERSVLHFIKEPRVDINHHPQVSLPHLNGPMVPSCYKRSVLHFIRQPREDVNHHPQLL